ncbi:MAG: ATP-binding protein [Eubacterium sp.]
MKIHITPQLLKGIIILIATTLLTLLGIQWLYSVDNKYSAGSIKPENGILSINDDTFKNQPLVFLIDQWQFYADVLLTPDALKQHSPTPKMVFIGEYPDFSQGDPHKSPYGSGTYVFNIVNSGRPVTLSLSLQEIFSSATIWVDGQIVEKLGDPTAQDYHAFIKNSVLSFTADANTEIVIETSNFTHYYSGIYYPPVLGLPQDVAHLNSVNQFFYAFLCFTSFAIALFTILVWFSPKRDPLFFYYGLMTLAFSLHVAYVPLRWLGVPLVSGLYALEDFSYFLVIFCVVNISSIIAQFDKKIIYRHLLFPISATMCAISAIIPIGVLPNAPFLITGYGVLLDFYQCFICFYLVSASFIALGTKDVRAYLLTAANTVLGISILLKVTGSNEFEPIYTGWQSEYCTYIIVLIFGILIARYYQSLLRENQKLTEHLEDEVALRTQELTTLITERKQFLSDVAHDLKAPISTIQAFIDLIRVGNVQIDEELSAYLLAIDQKSNEVQNRVRSLQEFTTQDETTLKKERLDIGALLHEIYTDTSPDTEANGLHFNCHLPHHPVFINGDKERLTRAFENLLYNAMSFTPIDGTITTTLSQKKGIATITVSDTGCGISADDQTKIFSRFFSSRSDKNGDSHGLGLYIVHYIIRAHHGTISVSSEIGLGTTFTVKLETCL